MCSILDLHPIPDFSLPHKELQIPKQRRKAVSKPQNKFASNNLQLLVLPETALLVFLPSHSLTPPASPQPVSGGLRSAAKEKTGKKQSRAIFLCHFCHQQPPFNINFQWQLFQPRYITNVLSFQLALGGGGVGGGGGGADAAFFVEKPSACVRKSPSLV